MRALIPVLLLTGCAFGDQISDAGPANPTLFDEAYPAYAPPVTGLARLADTFNPGQGVVPDIQSPFGSASVWAVMGDRLCSIDGNTGNVAVDIEAGVQPGHEPVLIDMTDSGYLLLDNTRLLVRDATDGSNTVYPMYGSLVDAKLLADSTVKIVADTNDGCVLATRLGGSYDQSVISNGFCGDAVLHVDGDLAMVQFADRLVSVDNQGTVETIDDHLMGVDRTEGTHLYAQTGDTSMLVVGDGFQSTVDLDADLIHATVQAGRVVALTSTPELVLADVQSGEILSSTPYYGEMDASVSMSDDGRGLMVEQEGQLAFFSVTVVD